LKIPLRQSLTENKCIPRNFFKVYNYFLIFVLVISCLVFINVNLGYQNLQTQYKNRVNNVEAKHFLVSEFKNSIGYGGFIHHFKNYILRSTEENYHQALKNIIKGNNIIKQYYALNVSIKEVSALRVIESVLDQYNQNLGLAKDYYFQNKTSSITQLDKLVKVDDKPLLEAILYLKQASNKDQEDIYFKEQLAMAKLLDALSLLITVILPLLIVSGIVINRVLAIKTKQLRQEIIVNKQLLKELNLNATAFDANEAILITDVNKVIIKVNQAFCLITGYAENEVIGKTLKILQSGEQSIEFYAEFWQSINEKGSWSGEIIDRKKNGNLFVAWANVSKISNEQGDIEYYLSHFSDMTEYKNTQAAFARRVKIESIVSDIAITVLETEFGTIDSTINYCLKILGIELDVDRSYLFSISEDSLTMSNTHEWCTDGIKQMIDLMQDLNIKTYSWLMVQLFSQNVVRIDDVDLMPVEAKKEQKEFKRLSIKSILLVPILDKGKVTGYFGFDRVRKKRNWRDEDIALFRMIAKIFHLAQYRHKIESENSHNLERTVQLLEENTKLLSKNRTLAIRTIQAQEQERHYLAHELHDELGQLVTAIRMDVNHLQTLLHLKENSSSFQMMSSIDGLSRQMISNLHSTIKRIRPETLDHLGLIPALNELVSDWLKHNRSVSVKTDFIQEIKDLDENITVTLYRALQEALTNISKYAHADKVEVSLQQNNIENFVQLIIVDNGVGLDSCKISKDAVGLLAMKERVNSLQGIYKISLGENNHGTLIDIKIPC